MSRNLLVFLLFVLSVGFGSRQAAAQPTPMGPETQVDTDPYSYSDCPQIGVAPDRSFEIVWSSGTNSPTDVRARHYNASGSPTDRREVPVSREFDGFEDYYEPTVLAVTPVSTGFRVLFETLEYDQVKFFRRRIDPSGTPVPGAARPIGAPDTQWVVPGPGDAVFAGKYNPSLHRLSLQKVDSQGRPAGTVYILNSRPFVLDTSTSTWSDANPVIKPLSDGGWVAVFGGRSLAAPGSPARDVIRARRFSAAGAPLGPDFDVNSVPAGAPGHPPFLWATTVMVASGPAGRFAVAWQVGSNSGWSIRARLFDAAGVPTAPETTIVQGNALEGPISMAFDNAGRILLVWLKDASFRPNYPTTDLRARLIGANGSPVGPQFRVQSGVSKDFDAPVCGSVVWTGDSWLITWLGYYLEDSTAIFLRRFG